MLMQLIDHRPLSPTPRRLHWRHRIASIPYDDPHCTTNPEPSSSGCYSLLINSHCQYFSHHKHSNAAMLQWARDAFGGACVQELLDLGATGDS